MPDDRPYQGRPSSDRPSFAGPRQFSGPRPSFTTTNSRPPFRPAPRVEVPAAPMSHSLRLRDGDREIEVSGSAAFVRQVLDDLPAMWARLHGEGSARPARIDLPARASEAPVAAEQRDDRVPESAPEPIQTAAPAARAQRQAHRHTQHAGRQGARGAQGFHPAPRGRGDPQAPRRQLHPAAGAPDPRAQRSEGLGHRRAAGHLPPALTLGRLSGAHRSPVPGAVVWRQGGGDTPLSLSAPSFAQADCRARSVASKFAECPHPPAALHPLRHSPC